jgi:hypothetical protein
VKVPQRRFPPPWSVEESEACFIVRDANGQALAYVYFDEEPGRRSAAKLPTRDEAWRTFPSLSGGKNFALRAANIDKLPQGLLQKPRASIDPTSAMTSTPDISPDCAH